MRLRGLMSVRRRARAAVCGGLAVFALLALPAVAGAQVLEIGDDGAVTVYDGPRVFTADGVDPLFPAPAVVEGEPAAPGAVTVEAPIAGPDSLHRAAAAHGLSPALIEAVAWRESRLRPGVVSPAGAIGEMQLMPGTARQLGVDPYNSEQNYRGGARYLSDMLRRYGGDLTRALAAYNAGPGAVDRYGGVPPYRETREYVAAILDRLSQRALAAGAGGGGR